MHEVRQLRDQVKQLRTQLAKQTKEIARLDELAETDPLTGLANRRSFEKEIRRRHAEQLRDGRGFCLMIIDVDGFKAINDQFGHAEGDRLLQLIASMIRKHVRASDIPFRIGGDEMAVILPGVNLQQAKHAASRLVEETELIIRQQAEIRSGLSIGLAESSTTRSIDDLIQSADRAMYQAKNKGGNRFETE